MGNRKFEFQLKFNLGRDLTDLEYKDLYDAGFHDSLIGIEKGVNCIDVSWEAATYTEAVMMAKKALNNRFPGVIIQVN